jgi:hypothetical protein
MKRRCLTAVLTIAYLAFQLAMVPHAHESIAAADHGEAHIHVSWLGGESSSSEHSHHGHSHEHAGHSHASDRHSEPEHDSDAVYLTNDPGITTVAKIVNVIDHLAFCPITTVATLLTSEITPYSANAFSSKNCETHCPLYLALRTLRI